jgi:hypothetical protein
MNDQSHKVGKADSGQGIDIRAVADLQSENDNCRCTCDEKPTPLCQ